MPALGRWTKSKFQKKPESSFKLLAAVLVVTLYLLIKEFSNPTVRAYAVPAHGARVQHAEWTNGSDRADKDKAHKVREAMKYTFWKYRENAWGHDDIKPVTGAPASSRNG